MRGTNALLYTDKHILKEAKTKGRDVVMAWINYKKSNEIIPQPWMIECRKMYKLSDWIINFIMNVMKKRKVVLTTGGRTLAQMKIFVASTRETHFRHCYS